MGHPLYRTQNSLILSLAIIIWEGGGASKSWQLVDPSLRNLGRRYRFRIPVSRGPEGMCGGYGLVGSPRRMYAFTSLSYTSYYTVGTGRGFVALK
jgi:hypothetical protein